MIKQLLKSVREYKKASLLAPIFVILEVAMEVVIPLLMATLIDRGIEGGDMPYIWKMGGALVAGALLSLTFGALSGSYAAKAAAGFARNLRHDMFYNVQNFSFSNIDKFSTSSIVTRLTTDVTNIQNAYMMVIRMAARSPAMILFSLIMAFTISSKVSLIFLGIIPVLGVGLYLIIRYVHPIFIRVFRTYDKLNNVVQENLHGIRVVKSFVREQHEEEKFGEISQRIYNDFSKAEKIIAFNPALMQFSVYACLLLISWIGAKLIVAGSMTTGQLVSFISYIMMILMSLMMLSFLFVMVIISRASVERTVELLNETPDLTSPENPVNTVRDGSISFHNVEFSYAKKQDKPCLSGIDIDIRSGETIGIIGSTGSSKTSLVQLIPRLYDVTGGTLSVGGADVRDYDLHTLRNTVAVVLQKNVLFSGTIKENLRWGNPDATDDELIAACKLAQADDFIRAFPDGYDTHIEQGGANVSGGQKQRLCIARALLKQPKILILDDSTSAVDTRTDAALRQAFREDLPETTKLIIAQRISSISDADRIIVMESGTINAIGTHEELLQTNTIYREVHDSQMKGGDFDEAE